MSSGIVADTCRSSAQVLSNSCADVRSGLNSYLAASGNGFTTVSCSADPVVVGTSISYVHTSGFFTTCSVSSITATSDSSSSSSFNSDAIVVTLMVIGVFFAFVYGYSSGKGFVK